MGCGSVAHQEAEEGDPTTGPETHRPRTGENQGLPGPSGPVSPQEVGLCGYHAVFFAAQDYVHPDVRDLETPNADVNALATVLRDDYGFDTRVFEQATRSLILDTLAGLRDRA